MFDMPCPICGVNLSGPGTIEIEHKKVNTWVKEHASELNWLDELVAVSLGQEKGYALYGSYDGYGHIEGDDQLLREFKTNEINIEAANGATAIGIKVQWELYFSQLFVSEY